MVPSSKRQRRYSVRFELGVGGLVGLTVVCLCVFVWFFLLGVWAGQTVLSPSESGDSPWLHRLASSVLPPPPPTVREAAESEESLHEAAAEPEPSGDTAKEPATAESAKAPATEESAKEPATEEGAKEPAAEAGVKEPAAGEGAKPGAVKAEPVLSGNSFFALQVGAFHEAANAEQAVAEWKGKGYEAFSRPPEGGSSLTRVFVGHFNDLTQANKVVAELEEKEKQRAYITLIPAAEE